MVQVPIIMRVSVRAQHKRLIIMVAMSIRRVRVVMVVMIPAMAQARELEGPSPRMHKRKSQQRTQVHARCERGINLRGKAKYGLCTSQQQE